MIKVFYNTEKSRPAIHFGTVRSAIAWAESHRDTQPTVVVVSEVVIWDWKNGEREHAVTVKTGDHVRIRDWDEGVGIVRKVGDDGALWVQTMCNMYRGYPAEMFVVTDEALSVGLEP